MKGIFHFRGREDDENDEISKPDRLIAHLAERSESKYLLEDTMKKQLEKKAHEAAEAVAEREQ